MGSRKKPSWDPHLVRFVRAAVKDHEEATEIARANPEVLNLRTFEGETALHHLAIDGYLESVKLLIELGADVQVVNKRGESVLAGVQRMGYEKVAALLIEAGAKP